MEKQKYFNKNVYYGKLFTRNGEKNPNDFI